MLGSLSCCSADRSRLGWGGEGPTVRPWDSMRAAERLSVLGSVTSGSDCLVYLETPQGFCKFGTDVFGGKICFKLELRLW